MSEGGLFGTDGIRDKANQGLLAPENVIRLGKIIAYLLKRTPACFKTHVPQNSPLAQPHLKNIIGKNKVIIARDTRASGRIIEQNMIQGLLSFGTDILTLGVFSTPGLAYLVRRWGAALGVMISASHNLADDNGIKIISPEGSKVPDKTESEIERLFFDKTFDPKLKRGTTFKFTIHHVAERTVDYTNGIIEEVVPKLSLKGLKLVVDCANGSVSQIVPPTLQRFGARLIILNDKPNGHNINLECGSLHVDKLSSIVVREKADLGIAFDGDGDRVLFVDESGETRDGDHLLGIFALRYKSINKLPNDALVSTVMANLGLEQYCQRHGVKLLRTDVGDRFVIQEMLKSGAILGGEPSGHIILLDHSSTGDGLITTLKLLQIMLDEKRPLSQLAREIPKYPQVQLDIPIRFKQPFDHISPLKYIQKRSQAVLGERGRILLRYSGTEPVARIMVEGEDQDKVSRIASEIAEVVKREIGI
jgi:phosphoglucosamine mutase